MPKTPTALETFGSLCNFVAPPDLETRLALTSVSDDTFDARRVKLTKELSKELQETVTSKVATWDRKRANSNLQLLKYSEGSRYERHQVSYLKLTENQKEIFEIIKRSGELPVYKGDPSFNESIRFYSIALGDEKLVALKAKAQSSLLRTSPRWAFLQGDGDIYDQMDSQVLLLDSGFDCVRFNDYLYINNVHNFRKIFGFYDQLERLATKTLIAINKVIPIENFDDLVAVATVERNVQLKLANISQKDYLHSIKVKHIEKTLRQFPEIDLEVKKNAKKQKAVVFEKANKWDFLKLFEDGFLESVLTGYRYSAEGHQQLNKS